MTPPAKEGRLTRLVDSVLGGAGFVAGIVLAIYILKWTGAL
jgi:hypothetical protein